MRINPTFRIINVLMNWRSRLKELPEKDCEYAIRLNSSD